MNSVYQKKIEELQIQEADLIANLTKRGILELNKRRVPVIASPD